jgi:hypothetical protein
LEENP